MTTYLFTHESCIGHDPGPMHPESPARLEAATKALRTPEFDRLVRKDAPKANVDQIARIHPRDLVEQILDAVPSEGRVMVDGDTSMSPGTGEAALRGVGALCAQEIQRARRPAADGVAVGELVEQRGRPPVALLERVELGAALAERCLDAVERDRRPPELAPPLLAPRHVPPLSLIHI